MTENSEQPSKRKAKKQKKFKPKARTPRGFRDMAGAELRLQNHMLQTISGVYEAYGFAALEHRPEYADALGNSADDAAPMRCVCAGR